MAVDLEWSALRPFVLSLRAAGFDGDIRFVTAGLSAATESALRAEGVILHPYRARRLHVGGRVLNPYSRQLQPVQPLYRLAVKALAAFSRDPRATRRRLVAQLSQLYAARYVVYLDLLEEVGADYDRVLLSDTRDVFFQRDPFAMPLEPGISCFLEAPHMRIRDCPFNSSWIRLGYGEAMFDQLAGRPISCSGVSIGDTAAVLGYLNLMVDEIVELRRQAGGIDQGVHNYLLHTGRLPAAHLVPNGEGPVLTIGYMGEIADADLVGPDGLPLPVLHQYDRRPALSAALLARLGEPAAS